MRKPQQRAFYRVLIKKSPYHSDRMAESYCNQSGANRRRKLALWPGFVNYALVTGGALADAATDAALQSLCSPQEVASLYVAENFMARAESSRTPWMVLRSVFHRATLSVKGFLVFVVCLIGYGFGAAFFIAALAKPFNPHAVGLWLSQDSFSLRLGMTDSPAHGRELLGWFSIPIGSSLGGGRNES